MIHFDNKLVRNIKLVNFQEKVQLWNYGRDEGEFGEGVAEKERCCELGEMIPYCRMDCSG